MLTDVNFRLEGLNNLNNKGPIMYGKIFHSIYDGTLVENWKALVTFQQLIVLADADGIVDMTAGALSRRTGIPLEIIEEGLNLLITDDPNSRTDTEDGKRLLPINPERNWGWQIVNHKQYRDLRTADDRREYMRNYMREKRSEDKLTKTNNSSQLTELANTDTDKDIDTLKSSTKNKFSDFDLKMSKYMAVRLLDIMPKMKTPNFEKWANEIRLMRDRDNRTEKEIKAVFDWANNDNFWKTNILSSAKLRKQFDRLSVNVNEGLNNGSKQGKGTNSNNKSEQVSNKLDEIAQRDIDQNGFTSELGGSDT